jgi:hypothetical protein
MRQDRDQADVALPAARTLMQTCLADDLFPALHDERQITLEVRVAILCHRKNFFLEDFAWQFEARNVLHSV